MIRLAASADESAHDCASAISRWLSRAILSRGRAFLAVSGGSTPAPMFLALADRRVDWRRVHLFFVDERCVPADHEQSNYRSTRQHFIARAGIPDEQVHRIRGEDDPQSAAAAYAGEIQSRLGPAGVFDVVHCGIGADGHTASLFPGDQNVNRPSGLCAAVLAPLKNQHRVTLLPAAITSARHLCVLADGPAKQAAVRRALSLGVSPLDTPARILDRASTIWFLSPSDIYEDFR